MLAGVHVSGRPETYIEVLEAAGFVDISWFGMSVPESMVFDREAMEHIMARIHPAPVIGSDFHQNR